MPLESCEPGTRGFYSGMQVSIRTKNLGAGWDSPTKKWLLFFQWCFFFFFLNLSANGRIWKEEISGPERCSPADYNRFQVDEIGNLKIQMVPP